ncbi:MAG: hypothetical protein JWO95_3065 [Verrucomicrobiales bacterium]|nr:hypothetical protein [Verrucomicrobiales bacterium]
MATNKKNKSKQTAKTMGMQRGGGQQSGGLRMRAQSGVAGGKKKNQSREIKARR